MIDDLLRLAEGLQGTFRSTEGPHRSAEGHLRPTEGCFRLMEGLVGLKGDHFRPIGTVSEAR